MATGSMTVPAVRTVWLYKTTGEQKLEEVKTPVVDLPSAARALEQVLNEEGIEVYDFTVNYKTPNEILAATIAGDFIEYQILGKVSSTAIHFGLALEGVGKDPEDGDGLELRFKQLSK